MLSPFRSFLFCGTKSPFLTCRVMVPRRKKLLLSSKSTTDVTPYEDDENLNPNAPVKFSTSRAAQWKVQYKAIIKDPDSLQNEDEAFRYAMYCFSLAGLILYAFLRGKNEWDEEQEVPLGKRMLLLREYQMNNELKAANANKEDTTDIIFELQKIAKIKKEYKYD